MFRRGDYGCGVSPGWIRGPESLRSREGTSTVRYQVSERDGFPSLPERKNFTTDGRRSSNDPSAGSPTDTLLRLLLPLNGKVRTASGTDTGFDPCVPTIRSSRRTVQSVGATGGVYKGQGRNQRELMTRAY
jgi:hypothetical protein